MSVSADQTKGDDVLLEGGNTQVERRCTFLHLLLALEPGVEVPAIEILYKVSLLVYVFLSATPQPSCVLLFRIHKTIPLLHSHAKDRFYASTCLFPPFVFAL